MNTEVFITCAVTGAGDTVARSEHVPVTPAAIADAALEAARAGAAVAHIHVRDPETGKGSRDVALYREVVDRVRAADVDVVLNLTAGMGGGTGTGGAPVIARVARDVGALTVGVVTKPFIFEGKKRMRQAEEGIEELKQSVDTLIVIPNQRLLSIAAKTTTMLEAFHKADDVLLQAVRGISSLRRA